MQQVYCSREAEFRQYSVLLRLNDGDILRSDAILQYVNDPSDFFFNGNNTNIFDVSGVICEVMFQFDV